MTSINHEYRIRDIEKELAESRTQVEGIGTKLAKLQADFAGLSERLTAAEADNARLRDELRAALEAPASTPVPTTRRVSGKVKPPPEPQAAA